MSTSLLATKTVVLGYAVLGLRVHIELVSTKIRLEQIAKVFSLSINEDDEIKVYLVCLLCILLLQKDELQLSQLRKCMSKMQLVDQLKVLSPPKAIIYKLNQHAYLICDALLRQRLIVIQITHYKNEDLA